MMMMMMMMILDADSPSRALEDYTNMYALNKSRQQINQISNVTLAAAAASWICFCCLMRAASSGACQGSVIWHWWVWLVHLLVLTLTANQLTVLVLAVSGPEKGASPLANC
jgi:hypothetical protein